MQDKSLMEGSEHHFPTVDEGPDAPILLQLSSKTQGFDGFKLRSRVPKKHRSAGLTTH